MIKHIKTIVCAVAYGLTIMGLLLGAWQMLDAVHSYLNHDPYAVLEVSSHGADKSVDSPCARR